MTEDLQRAMKEIKEYDGQKITLCVSKKKIHEKKKSGKYKVIFRVTCTLYLPMISLFPHEAVAEEKKNNEDKSKGIRKNVLKARLIIRNLSFQVQWATWESKTEGGEDTLITDSCLVLTVLREWSEASLFQIWTDSWG